MSRSDQTPCKINYAVTIFYAFDLFLPYRTRFAAATIPVEHTTKNSRHSINFTVLKIVIYLFIFFTEIGEREIGDLDLPVRAAKAKDQA